MKRFVALLVLAPMLAACEDTTGPEGVSPVELRFASVAAASASSAGSAALGPRAITLPAEDGVYEIDDIRLVVSDFELAGTATCAVEDDDDDEVEIEPCEFEGGPFLVDLPLDGGPLTIVTDDVADGTYTFVEFEVEDLDFDDGDEDDELEEQVLEQILEDLRVVYPDLPEGASMVASGTFVPTAGDPQPFTVYFEAEIEVEMPLATPLDVPADDALTIVVDPGAWFEGVDLHELDGELVEFELEIEDGFVEVEIDD